VFPKGDHLNIGVGAWKYASFTLRPKLAELCRRYGFDLDSLTNLRGHHLPVRVPGSPIARGPVAVAGDAAGLVDPLSGEGIHMAFASGRLAAKHGLRMLAGEAAGMSGYERAVDKKLQAELNISRKLQELFNFAPPPYVAMMRRSEKFWLFFCALIRGEMTYLDFVRMIGPMRLAMDFFANVAERRRMSRVHALSRSLRHPSVGRSTQHRPAPCLSRDLAHPANEQKDVCCALTASRSRTRSCCSSRIAGCSGELESAATARRTTT
jgi:hypothetical protein